MNALHHEISHRVSLAHESLTQAQSDGDDYLVDIRLGELESLHRLATEHGIDVSAL